MPLTKGFDWADMPRAVSTERTSTFGAVFRLCYTAVVRFFIARASTTPWASAHKRFDSGALSPPAVVIAAAPFVDVVVASASVVADKLKRIVEPAISTPPRALGIFIADSAGVRAPLLHPSSVARLASPSGWITIRRAALDFGRFTVSSLSHKQARKEWCERVEAGAAQGAHGPRLEPRSLPTLGTGGRADVSR